MVTYETLNTQNHKIFELSKVLNYLLEDRSMCDTDITCDLFFNFVDLVKEHLEIEDRHIYRHLLTHSDQSVKNMATKFMSGGVEIKKVFADYLRKWCGKSKNTLRIKDYEDFVQETNEMFEMVQSRIIAESENLYPLLRNVTGDQREVA